MKKTIITTASLLMIAGLTMVNAQDWTLTGNAGTDPAINFVGTTDNKAFRIKTNNGIRMHIKSNGDVGIGTTTPTSKFHVNGVITATGGTSTDWNSAYGWGNHALAGYLTSEVDPQVGANALDYASKWDGNALVTSNIYSSGTFVGINTTTAVGASQFVVGNTNASYGGMYLNSTGAAGVRKPFYGFSLSGLASCWTYFDEATNTFRIYNGGDRMTVTNTGNIGIGTTSPIANLHITPNSSTFAFRIDQGTTGDGILSYVNTTSSARTILSASSNVLGLYVMGNGRTGIGTTSPLFTLHAESSTELRSAYFYNTTVSASTTFGMYAGAFGTGTGAKRGGSFDATGGTGENIGVRGFASGGSDSWGGYFPTKTYTNELRVGTTVGATGFILCVGGKAICEEIRVELEAAWPDYVFNKDYNLMKLDDLEKYISQNNHLPGMPSSCEIEENGHHLGAVQTKLVEKTEENTLYILELKQLIDKLNSRIAELEKNK
jgi:hypothetical protein